MKWCRWMLVLVMGCTERNASTCLETHCPDPTRPFCDVDGTISGEPNACVAVDCEPGAFETCRGDVALTCNSAGNNYDLLECEFGCSDAAGGCNSCNTSSCEKHIFPKYLLTACNQLTDAGDLVLTSDTTLDTENFLNCSFVLTQTNGPEICVVRQKSIRIASNQTLTAIGGRALALVADRDLVVDGILDVSADGGRNGPGGGLVKSGTSAEYPAAFGGGGAGGGTAGGSGADDATAGAAANGGASVPDP